MEEQTKLQRGQKRCNECGGINASRQRVCIWCDTAFISKNTLVKGEIKDWRSLRKGDKVKVITGSGPYCVVKRATESLSEGERLYMGATGVFKITGYDDNGLKVFGASPANTGFAYLYMGKSYVSPSTGIYQEAYRIKKS